MYKSIRVTKTDKEAQIMELRRKLKIFNEFVTLSSVNPYDEDYKKYVHQMYLNLHRQINQSVK